MDGHKGDNPPETERRAVPREGCMIRARIEAPDCAPVDCIIWDMSPEGARVVVGDHALPDQLDLIIPILSTTKRATVRWRKTGQIGVSFP